MGVVLYHLRISHYNEKARFALAYKGIEHERRALVPGIHSLAVRRLTRGAHTRLPLLDLDGRRIGDSTAIIAALEQYRPDPPLYPADPAERARALALEDLFDEQLGPYSRAFFFASLFATGTAAGPVVAPGSGRVVQRLLTATTPLAKRAMRTDYGTPMDQGEAHRAKVVAAMDRLEAELDGRDYLVGDRFSVADLTAATLFTPVLDPPGREHMPSPIPDAMLALRAELQQRRGGAWVHEIFAKHR
ncbi:MAG TPA: glutathione S-transferase family protein [Solirubrobacteraceae bacterium]